MVLLVLGSLLAWCLAPLPLAMVVGRALRAAGPAPRGPVRQDVELVA